MKVGIASCYYNHNYGSMLQAYATQRIIEELGYEATTIRCNTPITYMTQPKIKYYFHKISNIDIVKTKMRQFVSKENLKKHEEVRKGIKIRDRYFDEFYSKYIKLSKLNNTRDDLSNFAEKCDAVIVGSDMLWHPVNVEHNYFTLSFVPSNIKKIAYATSFGTTKIPRHQLSNYKEFLERFDFISVRETSGVNVINDLGINNTAIVVLDPTLLFDGKEWMEIQKEESIISEKYILCYFLGVNKEHREFAQKLKETTGFKIVALQHLDEFYKNDVQFGDIVPFNIGPGEFVNLIRNAEYVCTDSFHGSCFSILNHKQFFTFNRFNSKNSQSTNTRIDSLLKLVNMENRRMDCNLSKNEIKSLLKDNIDYSNTDEKLNKERQRSIKFIKNALNV